jgi:hypothetical protein
VSRFADRLAPNLDHPFEAACAVRPPATTIATAIGAGVGAAIGSIAGSALSAGIGAGIGVIVAYVVLWLLIRGGEQSITMALVLTAERLELYRLGLLSASRPRGLIRAIPYAEISDMQTRKRLFELVVTVIADGGPLILTTPSRGGGAETVEALRRRIAA